MRRGGMVGRGAPLDDFDPMAEAFRDIEFNSYTNGPGAHMKPALQVESRRREEGGNIKLYVANIPSTLNEDGLRNIFLTVGEPLNVYLNHKASPKYLWGFVEFKTIGEAQNAINTINKAPPHFLTVQYAQCEAEKAERRRQLDEAHASHNQPIPPPLINPDKPYGGMGRGVSPLLKGCAPKTLKGPPLPSLLDNMYYDGSAMSNGYEMERFQHYSGDPIRDTPREVFGNMTMSICNDGNRRVALGRGSYMPPEEIDDSRAFRHPFYRPGMSECINNLLNKEVYYCEQKDGTFYYTNDDGTTENKDQCKNCRHPSSRICEACSTTYCTYTCLREDWVNHSKVCSAARAEGKNLPSVNGHIGPGGDKLNTEHSMNKTSEYDNSHKDNKPQYDKGGKGKTDFRSRKFPQDNNNKGFAFRNAKGPKKTFVRGKPIPHIKDDDEKGPKGGRPEKFTKSSEFDPQRIPRGDHVSRVIEDRTYSFEPPVPMDSFTEVLITTPENSNTYWVQEKKNNVQQMEVISKLNSFCQESSQPLIPAVNTKCAALYQGDWYRAKITSIQPDIRVFFIDFGNEEVCRTNELHTLPREMFSTPLPMAFKICMAEGTPDEYLNMAAGEALKVKPTAREDDINAWVVQVEGVDYPEPVKKEPTPIPYDSFVTVQLAVSESKTEYWVHLSSTLRTLCSITKELGDCSTVKITPRLGETYVKLYADTWCRAKVINEKPLRVFYIDFGNEEIVNADELHPVPASYQDLPPMAIKIRLAEGTSAKHQGLEPVDSLSVKTVDQMPDGTLIVQVEGDSYSTEMMPVTEKVTKPKVDLKVVTRNLQMCKIGSKIDFIVNKVVSDDHATGTLVPKNTDYKSYCSLSSISSKLDKLHISNSYKAKVRDSVVVEVEKGVRKRGYVMGAWNHETRVALTDFGIVSSVNRLALLPADLRNIPEAAVRCLFSVPIMKGIDLKNETLEGVVQDIDNGIVTVEFAEFGSAELVCWEPLIEEAGLSSIKLESGGKVALASYKAPEALYLHSMKQEHIDILNTLLQDVAAHCLKAPPLDREPLTGEFLGCKYDSDGNFYRAQVLGKFEDKYEVTFVDYGNSEKVSVSNMRVLPMQLKTIPCCAVKVGLRDVPLSGFLPSAMTYLNEMAAVQTELFVTFENKDLSSVILETITGLSLNKTLALLGEPHWKKALSKNTDPSEGHVFMATDLTYVKWPLQKKITITILGKMSTNVILACNSTMSYIRHITDTLTEEMTEYCESSSKGYNPRPNETCIAKYEDGKWYRAICVKPKTNLAEIFFVDFGSFVEVGPDKMRCMTHDFISAPALLKRVKIYGLPEKTTEAINAALDNLLGETTVHQAVVLEDKEDGNSTVWIPSLSDQIVEIGLPAINPPPLSGRGVKLV